MKITILPRAEKELRRLPTFDQIAIATKIRSLPDSAIASEEKLAGLARCYRVCVGHYRIVYRKTSSEVTIVLIGHRKDIYRHLGSLLR